MSNILSEVHPELVAEWSDKNLPLTPYKITYGSNKVVWWKGACGHEWKTSVKARSNGENCPICSGARVIEGINDLATLKPALAAEWSSKNDPLKPTMVTIGSHKKVIWQDKYGHEWTATVKSRALNGTGCPYCSHNKILVGFNDLASQRPQIASEWSERNYPLKPDMVTVFANQKVWWRCSKGHEWNTLISTRSGGSGCPYCSGQLLLKGFNDFATTHPQLAQEWSDRNLPLTPDMINEKSRRNVWWKCKECGYEWQSVVYARVKGTVCPVCADRAVMEGYNDLATTDAHLLSEWDYEKNKDVSPNKVSRNSMRTVWWKCSLGHSWKAKVSERAIEGKGCKVCEKDYLTVFPKLAVMYYAAMKHIKVQTDIDKIIGIPLEMYLPEEKVAIETVSQTENKDTNDNGELDSEDELIGTLTEKEIGQYEMNDLLYGRYFILESASPDSYIRDEGVYEVFIDTDGKTYQVENTEGKGFANEPMRGNLKIVKTSSDGKVEGFAFRITGANGYDVTLETDENGEIFLEGLRIGEYKISEVNNSVSAMYILPADKEAAVQVGSTTVVEMHNELRDTPKTGDNSKLGLWLALAGVSVAGIAACGIIGFKKKKKEDN